MRIHRHRSSVRGRKGGRRAFTLIELLIVIAILLGLFGIVAATLMNIGEDSDVDLQQIQFEMVERDALKIFKLHLGRYPTQDEGLAVLWDKSMLENEEDEAKWRGPYLDDKIVSDKWGSEVIYNAPSELVDGAEYDLISFGPDREEGTEDDITNHRKNADGEFESVEDFTVDDGG